MNDLNVLYEDNHVIVVIKPPNILSQQDNTNDLDMLTIVKKYIKEKYNKPGNVYLGLVHRLDCPTEGIMVFAKTSKAASRLSNDIKNHKFCKRYLAVVNHKLEKKEDEFVDYLKRKSNGSTVVTSDKDGKIAILKYKLLSYNKDYDRSLVEVELKTGRHHQIRVQFASRGYPLCGDQRYGKYDKTQLALIAHYLSFIHPVTKEKMEFVYNSSNNKYLSMFTL